MTKGANASQLGELIRKNKTVVLMGFVIAVAFHLVLWGENIKVIFSMNGKFNPIIFATNTIGFLLIWLVISFLIARLSVYKVLGVFLLLAVVNITSQYLRLPTNNPITIPSLLLFWLGIVYLLLPGFFKKYRPIILGIYGTVIVYFFIVRTAANYEEVHVKILSYFLTITVSFTFILWIYQQLNWLINVKLNQTSTELLLLKSQVNPHFFFNTLNNLYGLVVEKSERAPEMVLKLSDMMRYTIYEGKEDVVRLADEIQYLKNYMELHKIRYQKSVDIRFEHVVDGDLKVAPLLLIILLENAFKHGVESITENAFIHLELRTMEEQLQFRIVNNYEAYANKEKPGIGLDNLKKRLELIYPNRHQLQIEETDSIYKAKLTIQTNKELQ